MKRFVWDLRCSVGDITRRGACHSALQHVATRLLFKQKRLLATLPRVQEMRVMRTESRSKPGSGKAIDNTGLKFVSYLDTCHLWENVPCAPQRAVHVFMVIQPKCNCVSQIGKLKSWFSSHSNWFAVLPFGLPITLNPLNPQLNPICYLLALLGAHHFLHVSRIWVKLLTFRLLMSYTYIWSTHSWCF